MTLDTPWADRSIAARVLLLILATVSIAAVWHLLDALSVGEGLLLANTFATPTHVMRRVTRRLVNQCRFAAKVNRSYDPEYKHKGVKMGDTVKARLPQRYQVTIGATMSATPLTDRTVNISITDQTNIGFEYGSWAATLDVQDYMTRYGDPAIDQLVNNIDDTGLQRMYQATAKVVGTPGVVPGSTGTLPQAANQVYTDAVTKLLDVAVPQPLCGTLSPNMHGYLVNANTSLFPPVGSITKHFRNGQFAEQVLGIAEWNMDQNVVTHTVGALGGAAIINGAGQTGSTIVGDGATGSVTGYYKAGDVIQLAGVNDINPLNHRSTTRLKDFVVTADVDSDSSGNLSIPIAPELVVSGEFAVATGSPADGAAITTFGHASSYADVETPQGMIFHKDAYALVMADLVLPRGLWMAERMSNAKLGVSIRMLKDHDVVTDLSPARMDTAHGWAAVREELGCRVCS